MYNYRQDIFYYTQKNQNLYLIILYVSKILLIIIQNYCFHIIFLILNIIFFVTTLLLLQDLKIYFDSIH